jgi:hypothetical protein
MFFSDMTVLPAMQAAFEFGLLGDSISECAEDHQEGEDSEDRKAAAPEEQSAGALAACHGQHLGEPPQYDMSGSNPSSGSPP